jgi:hypothetical protein
MNKLSIVAIVAAAVMLIGVTFQNHALAFSGGDTLAQALSKVCSHAAKSINPRCNSGLTDTHDFFVLPTP